MKESKSLKAVVYIITLFLIAICSSSNEGSDDLGGNREFIVASVEGFSFESSRTIDATTAAKIDVGQFVTLLIQGFDNDGNAIVLSVS